MKTVLQLRRAAGLTYLSMLVAVVIVNIFAAVTAERLSSQIQREKERELLFRGEQYRLAIKSYYESGAIKEFPLTISYLLKDPRFPFKVHLRKQYVDPLLPQEEWRVVRNERGQIVGVYSSSKLKPFKQAGFALKFAGFDSANHYSDWHFVFKPEHTRLLPAQNAPPKP